MASTFTFVHGRRKGSKGKSKVELRIYCEDKKHTYATTPVEVEEEYWDQENRMVSDRHPLSQDLNYQLLDFRKKFETLEENKGSLYVSDVKFYLEKSKDKLKDFTVFAHQELANSNTIGISTYIDQVDTLKKLGAMRKSINFTDINQDLINDFEDYLSKTLKLSQGTRAKHHKNLKKLIHLAVKRGYIYFTEKDHPYADFEVVFPDYEGSFIYLSIDEIRLLEDYRSTLSPSTEKKCLDCWLSLYYTVQRWSDRNVVRKDIIREFQDGAYLDFIQAKTKTRVIVPVSSKLKDIMRSYYGSPRFDLLSIHKVSSTIKTACRKAGIDNKISVNRGGKNIVKPKFELVSTHTARRSGATNLYLAGVPIYDIMKITGHKSEASIKNYLRITKVENAQKLSKHPFFV